MRANQEEKNPLLLTLVFTRKFFPDVSPPLSLSLVWEFTVDRNRRNRLDIKVNPRHHYQNTNTHSHSPSHFSCCIQMPFVVKLLRAVCKLQEMSQKPPGHQTCSHTALSEAQLFVKHQVKMPAQRVEVLESFLTGEKKSIKGLL